MDPGFKERVNKDGGLWLMLLAAMVLLTLILSLPEILREHDPAMESWVLLNVSNKPEINLSDCTRIRVNNGYLECEIGK